MSFAYPYSDDINLHVRGRISAEDAGRQENTAREILRRLKKQPGLILADEVGMGKTFVALAVGISVALADERKRPVVVMVPPSLREKWPRDFDLFLEKCVTEDIRREIERPMGTVKKAVDFLKLLDDPPGRRKSIVFVTHGAMSRGLNDGWVKLALIYRALYDRKDTRGLRRAICRSVGHLLYMHWVDKKNPDVWEKLLSTHPKEWLDVLRKYGVDPEGDDNPDTDDDPVPETVCDVLWKLNTDRVYEALKEIPYRRTRHFKANLAVARTIVNNEIRILWKDCIKKLRFNLPLLILDEAHHLKNARTKLASLFQVEDARADAEEISRGPLQGVFERMLFLTATPFQLGHYELCSVLQRFSGISWKSRNAPPYGKDEFLKKIEELSSRLDSAQEAAVRLDTAWGLLRKEDLVVDGKASENVGSWWGAAQKGYRITTKAQNVLKRFQETKSGMAIAQEDLQPWVIRHLKPKKLPSPHDNIARRINYFGKAIIADKPNDEMPGIGVEDKALLPFLLAARATAFNPDSRPVFAEGLASSYEAFLYTRKQSEKTSGENASTDVDDEQQEYVEIDKAARWYLDKLKFLLPLNDVDASASHPKVSATVNRTLELWRKGEKALIFCHYIATGRALRQHMSRAIQSEIIRLGSDKLSCEEEKVLDELDRTGDRFFDEKSPVRRAFDDEIGDVLGDYPKLSDYKKQLTEIARRYIRTPSFLVRFFPLGAGKLNRDSIITAFGSKDESGLTLRKILEDFFEFLVVRCSHNERILYITALESIQTGSHVGADVQKTFGDDEIQGDRSGLLIANVRLVNGQAGQETRQKLLLTFNTPFYPEVLIASSVMAEGVDLQLNCRYVIHHDLSWNPSTLEQRTGRVDRIGAKVERCGQSVCVYIPYIAETQDEKMYRVVMDRERWFKVVMGEKFKIDAKTTEKLAERIPLADALAQELSFKLGVG